MGTIGTHNNLPKTSNTYNFVVTYPNQVILFAMERAKQMQCNEPIYAFLSHKINSAIFGSTFLTVRGGCAGGARRVRGGLME